MQGYLKNPEATREAFTTDGWYRTGTLERWILTVRICHRTSERTIIKGGENISPREIDDVLYRHKRVMEAARSHSRMIITGKPLQQP
ncbi:MAG: hypothetical protein Ct9H300mP28_38090 [Pseudomonadota bacterium]|nr:MAG: hypothetical protein Ct9H300mP28_38090 [Pseudomonadota bacterium]